MKNIVIAYLIAASSGLAAAPQASAKNEGLAALGGFIGGLVVGSSIHASEHRVEYRSNYQAPDYCPPAPICEAPTVRYAPEPRGYWREVPVKAWVPATWVTSYDRRGCPVRVYQGGYYTYSTDRVWVGRG